MQQSQIVYQFIDITLHPPSAKQLHDWFNQAGLSLKNWFNTSGVQYRELKIKNRLPQLTPAETFNLLASNGRLIKRPIVSNSTTISNGTKVSVGFKAIEFNQTWC